MMVHVLISSMDDLGDMCQGEAFTFSVLVVFVLDLKCEELHAEFHALLLFCLVDFACLPFGKEIMVWS